MTHSIHLLEVYDSWPVTYPIWPTYWFWTWPITITNISLYMLPSLLSYWRVIVWLSSLGENYFFFSSLCYNQFSPPLAFVVVFVNIATLYLLWVQLKKPKCGRIVVVLCHWFEVFDKIELKKSTISKSFRNKNIWLMQ